MHLSQLFRDISYSTSPLNLISPLNVLCFFVFHLFCIAPALYDCIQKQKKNPFASGLPLFFLYFKLSFSQILYPYKIPLFPAFAVNLTLWPLSGHCPSQDMRIDVKNFNNLGTSWSACVDSCVHHFCIPLFSLIFGLQKSKKIVFFLRLFGYAFPFVLQKHATSSILIVRRLTSKISFFFGKDHASCRNFFPK